MIKRIKEPGRGAGQWTKEVGMGFPTIIHEWFEVVWNQGKEEGTF